MSVTQVKYFHSGMAGAPVLNNAPGSLIAVLDACLVNGWGTATVDSVVISGGVVTVTRGAGHPFEPDNVVELSGATVSGGSINGEHKVTAATASTYSFPAPAGVGDQTASGTISHKVAAAGWTKAFSGTNLAAYRMDAVEGLGHYLRVDDTDTRNARVRGYTSMSDVNTGGGEFPTLAQQGGAGFFWTRTNNAGDAVGRPWQVIADSRMLYVAIQYGAASPSDALCSAFGEFASLKQPDAFSSVLVGSNSSTTDFSPSNFIGASVHSVPGTATVVARGVSGLGSAAFVNRVAFHPGVPATTSNSGQITSAHVQFPNAADNALLLGPLMISESAPVRVLRGSYPGAWYVPMQLGASVFANRAAVEGVNALPGRRLRAVDLQGPLLFDVTGPWR